MQSYRQISMRQSQVQLQTDLAGEALHLRGHLLLLSLHQEETVGSPRREGEANQLKHSGDEWQAINSINDIAEEVDGQERPKPDSHNRGFLLAVLPVSLDLVSKLRSTGVEGGQDFLLGLLDALGGFLAVAESLHHGDSARRRCTYSNEEIDRD